MKKILCTLCILLAISCTANAQSDSTKRNNLSDKLATITKGFHGKIGYAIVADKYQTCYGDTVYAMQSTYKFPLAIYILHLTEKGTLSLTQKVHVNKSDLRKTWSPLRDKYPEGNIDITVAELLKYTISQSDNNACDILFNLAKGPNAVNKYIREGLGRKSISIKATEAQMAKAWNVQYTNWVSPLTMTSLLTDITTNSCLDPQSGKLLLKWMTESENSDKRIKGLLPPGTTVAHKTGTSDTNPQGITAAINDIGIVYLPNGQHFTIAVYIMNTSETQKQAEHVIAEIARAAYDYYTGQ